MKEIAKEEAFQHGLPKWPQMLVSGKPVTAGKAKEIIFATDTSMTSASPYSMGNDRRFTEMFRSKTGYDRLQPSPDYTAERDMTEEQNKEFIAKMRVRWEAYSKFQELAGFLDCQYVTNTWAASCFVFGPSGWCHPNGNISFIDNVGKWPEVEDVFNDWEQIAARWPFLDIWVTLMSGEGSQDDTKPVVSFHIFNGQVTCFEGTMEPHQNKPLQRNFDTEMKLGDSDYSNEHGLPESWVDEFAQRVRPLVDQVCEEFGL